MTSLLSQGVFSALLLPFFMNRNGLLLCFTSGPAANRPVDRQITLRVTAWRLGTTGLDDFLKSLTTLLFYNSMIL